MRCESSIMVFDNKPELLAKAFSAELKNPNKERSFFAIKKGRNSVEFNIKAEDAVALRATSDSIIKLLIVYEKMKKI